MNCKNVFIESAYAPEYHIHNGDDVVSIEICPRSTSSFGQMRAAFYEMKTFGFSNRQEMLKGYMNDRRSVADKNKVLHNLEYHGNKIHLTDMLDEFCEWKDYPKQLKKIKLIRVRWIYYHGNWKAFVGDDGTNYWLCSWIGS